MRRRCMPAWVLGATHDRGAVPLLRVITVGVSLAVGARLAAAQQISGTLKRSIDSLPIAGALVVLSDTSGRDVARTVSTERGTFGFAMPQGGAFRLRVLRIGRRPYGPHLVSVPASGPVAVALFVPDVPIELPTMTIAADRRGCGMPRENTVLGILISEARKALALSDATLADRRFLFVVETWRRRQTPNLRTIDSVPTVSMDRGWPIRSAPPENLRDIGFVRYDPDDSGATYFGPDAGVLFADWFLDAHCLELAPAPAPGLLALDFRPARPRGKVGIAGRFVFDSSSLALRELNWRWVGLPSWVPDEGPGGFLRFQQLASGGWLPVAWSLRAPVEDIGVRSGPRLREYIEFGGRVVRQADSADAALLSLAARRPATSVLEGIVADTSGRAIADALVAARPLGARLVTDSSGRFRFDPVPPGMTVLHVQSVGYTPADFAIRVAPDTAARVAIRLTPRPVTLDTITVSGAVEILGLQIAGFYERMRDRQRGAGTSSFVSPEDIERRHPQQLSQLIAQLPGVHVVYENGMAVPFGRNNRCVLSIWVDGGLVEFLYGGAHETQVAFSGGGLPPGRVPPPSYTPPPKGSDLDTYVPVDQVVAIEVYPSPSEVPPEFDAIKGQCGAIVIWTGSRR